MSCLLPMVQLPLKTVLIHGRVHCGEGSVKDNRDTNRDKYRVHQR